MRGFEFAVLVVDIHADMYLELGRVGLSTFSVFILLVDRVYEIVFQEIEACTLTEVSDWKHTLENRLEANVFSLFCRDPFLKKFLVAIQLNRDEIVDVNCRKSLGKSTTKSKIIGKDIGHVRPREKQK
jgi:hypothetical protein